MNPRRVLHLLVAAALGVLALLTLPAYTEPARLVEWLAAFRLCG